LKIIFIFGVYLESGIVLGVKLTLLVTFRLDKFRYYKIEDGRGEGAVYCPGFGSNTDDSFISCVLE